MTTPKLTIAVTGSQGQIGRAVTKLALDEGHTVLALDRAAEEKNAPQERYSYKSVDLLDYEAYRDAVRDGKCDAIIHLAAVYTLMNPKDPHGPPLRAVPEHQIHNWNTTMSWNTLGIAAELGINRVSLASSVNAMGLLFSKRPRIDYLPVDEKHPRNPEDAYSVCKLIVEEQSNAFARRYPDMRIATFRPHWVIPESLAYDPEALHAAGGTERDLWGWVSEGATARAFLLGVTAPESTFPPGHETFFIVAPTMCRRESSRALVEQMYPEVKDFRREFKGNESLFDCSKAERMLGWTERAFLWTP